MKYVDEYRDPAAARALISAIARVARRDWTVMEVCGGQTHTLLKSGILQLLPAGITLVHGPGCPVCVTPLEQIDKALEIAARRQVIFCSFGDMLRVPGSAGSLFDAKAAGGDVRIVYSPLDAVNLARDNPRRQVVFFAVGFETTAPANAVAVEQAGRTGLRNFSILSAHVLVPPALEAILQSPGCRVQGFLAPGHVCAVTGLRDYERIAETYRVPIVVTGFEPVDLLDGIRLLVEQLERGSAAVENQYSRVVRTAGNPAAQDAVSRVFEICPRKWRGIGEIPASGLRLRAAYREFDAEVRFNLAATGVAEPPECISGLVLQGIRKPHECSAFGIRCTPETPMGAPMVSSEGACAAYYLYGRQ
ncbi:MAG: hydrogenase formation protein HypD [Bryobacterales bacterium]|nr:hydrogenase formation protein HypD [Bryobacterales bacterium]